MMQNWFKEAKLGIFIHYGIYAVGDVSESWSFHNGAISYEDYMKQCEGFTASQYDPKKWATLFKKIGAKYVVLTAKHHDGVALYDTKYSDLNVVKKTPAGRDLIAPFVEAVREADMKVGIYYSLIDWSDDRYRSIYPEGVKPEESLKDIYGSPAGGSENPALWKAFLDFNNHQLKELMTNYGEVDLLWFDGDWERSAAQWNMPKFREYLHSLNPNVVLNSRMQGYGDYSTPEQGSPIYPPEGPWELCLTMNTSWGYRPSDDHYKTSREIVRIFCDCITEGGNLLLDIGPMENGAIDPIQEKILLDLGSFVNDNEEAIFGTDRGIGYRHFLGGSTLSKDQKTLYLFVYDKPIENIYLKGTKTPAKRISVLHTGQELSFRYPGTFRSIGVLGTCAIHCEDMVLHPMTTVIKVEFEDELVLDKGHGQVITDNQ